MPVLPSAADEARAPLYGDDYRRGGDPWGARLFAGFDASEHPVALQLGGSEPAKLVEAAKIGEAYGYDEVNLNVGCPSDRVQSGAFGACLMREPALVAECVAAMTDAVRIPVTVKCRIGVDDQDPNDALFTLVEKTAKAGCTIFIVHARKAWLQGLSPKENRTVPPLDYEIVYRLKQERPDLTIVLNGGLETIEQSVEQLEHCDGVMLGRASYGDPYLLASVDREIYGGKASTPSREEVAAAMSDYVKKQFLLGVRPHSVTRHMLGLYHGAPGARRWRRIISENAPIARDDILDRVLTVMNEMKMAV